MSEIPFKTARSISGKIRLKFECPKCSEKLESGLEEAGNNDACLACGQTFVVPGIARRRQLEQEKIEKERAAEAAAAKKAKIKELERLEQARKAESEQQRLSEETAENQRRLVEAKNLERQTHGEYVYRVVYFPTRRDDMAAALNQMISQYATSGWEYMQLDLVDTYEPPGCIGALLGASGERRTHHLATFRRRYSG